MPLSLGYRAELIQAQPLLGLGYDEPFFWYL